MNESSDFTIILADYQGDIKEVAIIAGWLKKDNDKAVKDAFDIKPETEVFYCNAFREQVEIGTYLPHHCQISVLTQEKESTPNNIPNPDEDEKDETMSQATSNEPEPVEHPAPQPMQKQRSSSVSSPKSIIKPSHKKSMEPYEDDKEVLPKIKSAAKLADNSEDQKTAPQDNLTLVFIGQVGAGKSTICGGVLVGTGKIEPHEIKRCEEDATTIGRTTCYYPYIMDINEEERIKGRTMECGCSTFSTKRREFVAFDTPGNISCAYEAIKGVAMADVAVLVLSAKKNDLSSGMEVALEHALIARSSGIKKFIVAVNKMEDQTVKWSQKVYEEIKEKVTPMLKERRITDVEWIPISGITGENVAVKTTICEWYKGPTLIELLETIPAPQREYEGAVRVSIMSLYENKLYGRVHCGKIEVGSQLVEMPSENEIVIVSMKNYNDEEILSAKAGDDIIFKVKGGEKGSWKINTGSILCNKEDRCFKTEAFRAKLKIVGTLSNKPILTAGYKCVMHLKHLLTDCSINQIVRVEAPAAQYRKSMYGLQGEVIDCIITPKDLIAGEKYSSANSPAKNSFGTIVLRDEGKTIAIGIITKYHP